MTTTLSEGVKVPDVGSVNWAGDLEVNWNLLNGALANLSGNVKLDRDNTWTGEQSFTLPIVGSITGTAAKAIADEDGTSIKTGYGKLAGTQTWTGVNTFTGAIDLIKYKNTSIDLTDTTSSVKFITQQAVDKNNLKLGECYWSYNASDNTSATSLWSTARDNIHGGIYVIHYGVNGQTDVVPANNTHTTNLGNSSYKWKTINGVNPGALSLPDLSSDGYVDLSGNIRANTQYTYTAPSDGWLCLYVQTSGFHAENAVAIFNGAGSTDSHRWANSAASSINLFRMGVYHGAVSVPVRSGNTYFCYVNVDSSTSLSNVFFYFYKAQGNV